MTDISRQSLKSVNRNGMLSIAAPVIGFIVAMLILSIGPMDTLIISVIIALVFFVGCCVSGCVLAFMSLSSKGSSKITPSIGLAINVTALAYLVMAAL